MSRRIGIKLSIFWLLIGVLHYGAALALSTDSEQPIHIEADRGELDNNKQVAIYRGNVHLIQGTLHIDSDVLTIFYTPDKKLKKVIATGQPVWYRQRPNSSDEDIRARALKMEYHADNSTIYLFQQAHVWQGVNEFTGDRIEYDTAHHIVRGQGSKTGVGRVHVTIHPNDKETPVNNPIPENPADNTTSENPVHTPSPIKSAGDPRINDQKPTYGGVHGRTTTWLNLRTGPGSDQSKVTLLPPRAQVAILGRQDEWLHIATLVKGESVEGWVHADFIRLLDEPRK